MTADRATLVAAAQAAMPGAELLATSLARTAIIEATIDAVEPLIRADARCGCDQVSLARAGAIHDACYLDDDGPCIVRGGIDA